MPKAAGGQMGVVKLTNHAILISVGRAEPTMFDQVGVDDGVVEEVVYRVVHMCVPGEQHQHSGREWMGA